MSEFRLAVTGGRHYRNRGFLLSALSAVHARYTITMIIHGATPTGQGADWLADEWAGSMGIEVRRVPVDYGQDGPWPGAGPRRNYRMLNSFKPHRLAAFHGDTGTESCINCADRLWIPVWDWREASMDTLFEQV